MKSHLLERLIVQPSSFVNVNDLTFTDGVYTPADGTIYQGAELKHNAAGLTAGFIYVHGVDDPDDTWYPLYLSGVGPDKRVGFVFDKIKETGANLTKSDILIFPVK